MVTPALEPVEQAVALPAAPAAVPVSDDRVRPESAHIDSESAFTARAVLAQRASRSPIRRAAIRPYGIAIRPSGARPGVTPAARRPARPAARPAARSARASTETPHEVRKTTRSVRVRAARTTRTRVVTRSVTRQSATPRRHRVMRLGNMTAVVAYAKSQVGRRYVSGGEGAAGFDCSGLTKQAYARAGIRLPHSSGGQAARARRISRSQARAGDLVVGRGHVGIYMGNGMMIDAGNHRTGVVYRKLYSGLSVERL
ncbi:C40 family peptidase [Paractinoplanes toevensis]|uniref:NlpC/P60 domain-containing protein n=1 Tax=Paractinoplanes toevensis TaxID=571911 RepID=A0A920BQU7_9ACTN|nr:NlpC/P60 family protein [Actinoplanes toevensis]GIM97842.1 hypothetical protein Ato02nite_096350 [Actinoplanes toevensis]